MVNQQALIEAALDRLGEGFAIFDADNLLVSCNKIFRDLRDLPEDLCVLGMRLEALIRFNGERGDFGPGDPEPLIAERTAEIFEAKDREVERRMTDGKTLRIRYQQLDGGGLIMSLQDRMAETASREAEQVSRDRLSIVSRATNDGLYDWDVVSDVLVVSNRLNALFGFNLTDLASQQWVERVHPDDQPHYRATMLACFKAREERFTCEYRIQTDGVELHWACD